MACTDKLELQRLKMKETLVGYFTEELKINTVALEHFDKMSQDLLYKDADPRVQQMREQESIVLRDRVTQTSRHLSAIQRMI